jgi:hypothetical protein
MALGHGKRYNRFSLVRYSPVKFGIDAGNKKYFRRL